MASWSFLSSHGRVLLFLARDPGLRLRDIAAKAAITERSAYGIVSDLTAAGYITKHKDGRRNRYQIQRTCHCRSPPAASRPSAKPLPCSRAPAMASRRSNGQPPI
jgi:MarR family